MTWHRLRRLVPEASAGSVALLDPARGLLEAPIRSEIFGLQRFRQHAAGLAQAHHTRIVARAGPAFVPRLYQNVKVLREVDRYLASSARTGYHVTPAGEWLLDNFHLLDAQLKEIHDRLPSGYFRHLPVLVDAHLAGLPRVYGVAWAFIAHNDSAFDADLLAAVLVAYQEQRDLTLGELWALPTTLRVILIENLRRLAERVAANAAAREVANCVSDHIDRYDAGDLDWLLAAMRSRGVRRAFLLRLAQRQQDAAETPGSRWYEWARQTYAGIATERLEQHAEQTSDNLSVSNAVKSLRSIGDARWRRLVGDASALVRTLETAPAYRAEHGDTQDESLHAIERLARRSGRGESSVAGSLLGLMRANAGGQEAQGTPGYWLHGDGRGRLEAAVGLRRRFRIGLAGGPRRWILGAYLALLGAGGVGLVAWTLSAGAGGWSSWWLMAAVAVAAWFPASEAVGAMVNRLISEFTRPKRLPRLALADGIPADHRVLVVMPALLVGGGSVVLARQLERHYLANPEQHAQFALLTDWADAMQPRLETDAAILAGATAAIAEINRRHPPDAGRGERFLLLHRERSWCQTEGRWVGWERKRGKLEQLVAVLAEESGGPFLALGPLSAVAPATRYIVTLDSDTQFPPGRLRELVGIAAHPLNHPRIDPALRRVVGGYGILQPRVATPLPRPEEVTPYHWLFAGQCGVDPYSAANSEVYQDLFGEGTFSGKGLLNVGAMHAVLAQRLPAQRILSHDLLEGAFARCAAVTDVTVIEDMPIHADVAAARVHRWTRGDWQLLTILLRPRRYPIGAINRWKMLDNLRRSLVAPMSLALVSASLVTPAVPPWAALALVAAGFCGGPIIGALTGLVPSGKRFAPGYFYRKGGADVVRALATGVWSLALLLQQALLLGDAVLRALWRMLVSRRHLLQWTTAAAAQAAASIDRMTLVRRHRRVSLAAIGLTVTLFALGTPHPGLVATLGLVWAASPLWVWWVSRPRAAAGEHGIAEADQCYLQAVARDSWRLFERWVTDDDHQLPPDNVQTLPHTMVAHRTSPTNIGLYLLSVTCARRFGWIGSEDMVARLEATLTTLARLQRHHGHFLNWYDTTTLEPLLPAYVSTVDSGNLCGHLLAVAEACLEMATDGAAEGWTEAAIAAARERLSALPTASMSAAAHAGLEALLAEHDPPGRLRADPSGFTALLAAARADLLIVTQTTDGGLADDADAFAALLGDYLATLASALRDVSTTTAQPPIAQRLRAVAVTCRRIAAEAEFGFLFDRGRRLLRIGYRVAEQQHDTACYDLLASEARLTSLWAIAKGDIPVVHWAALGRPAYALGSHAGLRSWAGSMFEYRMASLVLDEPQGSLLAEAGRVALREQIAFGRAHDTPWGISESAYAARDHTLAYQYAPQGVPRLALRRIPPDDLVVAPYASVLAVELDPGRTVENLRRLEQLGARAVLGFIEALDFTPARQIGAAFTLVATHMAHHQGMSIVALTNLLFGGLVRTWCMRDARIAAVAPLLHEAPPRQLSRLLEPVERAVATDRRLRNAGPVCDIDPAQTRLQPTHLLSNGRYSVLVRANGAGWSRFGAAAVSRWRDDALRDGYGTFFYLRRAADAAPASLTYRPAPAPSARYRGVYHIDRLQFETTWPDLAVQSTLWVSPEDDIEFRQIELHNRGDAAIDLDLLSCFEASLAPPRADEAHPAFANLFVQACWSQTRRALFLERRPRLAAEPEMHVVHFLAETDPSVGAVSAQADRGLWLGRYRDASQPLAAFAAPAAPGAEPVSIATGLDPVAALSVRLRLGPQGRARVTIATAAADTRAALDVLVDRYSQRANIARASMMSATFAGIRLRELRLNPEQLAAILSLTTLVVFTIARNPGGGGGGEGGAVCDRRTLWRFGISGDHPLVVVFAGEPDALALVGSLVHALRLWSWSGVPVDLVVVNTEPTSYLMPLQRELAVLHERFAAESRSPSVPATGGMHVIRESDLAPEERSTLRNLAVVRIVGDGRPLKRHVQDLLDAHAAAVAGARPEPRTLVRQSVAAAAVAAAPRGGFQPASGEFRFEVDGRHRPPRPWINVLANPAFGCQIADSGAGYTWAENSRLHQLTAWSNDPVSDPAAEWFLIEDAETGSIRNVAGPAPGDEALGVRHGQGYTSFEQNVGACLVKATWCVDTVQAVKHVHMVIVNRSAGAQRLRLVAVVEWMLGGRRGDRGTVRTGFERADAPDGASAIVLTCEQRESAEGFGGTTAFLAAPRVGGAGATAAEWTCDRSELFDAAGRLALPHRFEQRCGVGLDPCAAIRLALRVAPGATVEYAFVIGHAESPAAARGLARQALAKPPAQRLDEVRESWDQILGTVTVSTPDPLFDALVNRWLLYQTVACRLWARAGFYQAGGAYGFRDQLQDAMALAITAPQMLRYQILVGAGRQFVAGDVQHWWHAPTGVGVRTRFSDDLLWLVQACTHYLEVTQDATLLDEVVPFLDGPPVPPAAEDAYFVPQTSAESASVFEHCARALDRSLAVGVHGLPLMGTGDWNDGMNRVGHEGRGESVWLAWFLCRLVADFAPVARTRGEAERASRWELAALGWRDALQTHGWDGGWYRRAFFDDGQALGADGNPECRIDLIAQAWSVLASDTIDQRQRLAMAAVTGHLIDTEANLVRLLDPPLQHAVPSAGYIQAYPPGVRENGGQYSHAGVWAVMAYARLGDADQAFRVFRGLSPAHRSADPVLGPTYGLEPYVMAGDIYSQPPYVGRGGWSWYTGSAAWMYRAAIESICGLRVQGDTVSFDPRLPSHWPAVTLTLVRAGKRHVFVLRRSAAGPAPTMAASGAAIALAPGAALVLATVPTDSVHVVSGTTLDLHSPDPEVAAAVPAG